MEYKVLTVECGAYPPGLNDETASVLNEQLQLGFEVDGVLRTERDTITLLLVKRKDTTSSCGRCIYLHDGICAVWNEPRHEKCSHYRAIK